MPGSTIEMRQLPLPGMNTLYGVEPGPIIRVHFGFEEEPEMPFTPCPAGIELKIAAEQYGQERMNILHCRSSTTSPTPTDLHNAALHTATLLDSHRDLFHTSVQLLNVTAKDISVAGGAQDTVTFGTASHGTGSGDALPSNCSLALSLKTGFSGRSAHGRMFMFGLCTLFALANDIVSPAYIGACTDFLTALIAALDAAAVPLSVFSRKHSVMQPITGFSIDNTLDSQRRRLVGRGR